jgi:hypothetical protein
MIKKFGFFSLTFKVRRKYLLESIKTEILYLEFHRKRFSLES